MAGLGAIGKDQSISIAFDTSVSTIEQVQLQGNRTLFLERCFKD